MKLRKITLNLFDADVEELSRIYGYGWSERVREMIHQYLKNRKEPKDERSR